MGAGWESHLGVQDQASQELVSLPSAPLRRLRRRATSRADLDPSLDADVMLVASALALSAACGAVWCAGGAHAHLTTRAWPSSAGGVVVAQAVPLPHSRASQAGVGRYLPSVDVFRAQGSDFSIVIVTTTPPPP